MARKMGDKYNKYRVMPKSEIMKVIDKELHCLFDGYFALDGRFIVHQDQSRTLGNLTSLWGDIISVVERNLKPISFYKAYFHILVKVPESINEIVELEIDSKVFKFFVCEFEPPFSPSLVWCEVAESLENFISMDSKENQKLNKGVGGHGNELSGSLDENTKVVSLMEAGQTTCDDVEACGATSILNDKR
ncbi:hypothetical protein V6N13_109200 [Hibiscus sabdariffa]